ncbi:MAG: cation diffusion facilitator family transporter [Candidatus Methanomethylophilaceae archaeon]|jgi:cation diffusion facilitator family transporter
MQKGSSKISVIAAIVANLLIGIVKFVAAGMTASAAMMSEGIHSLVDSGNGILVLYGMKKADKKADREHPFGYGKELYFWTLVVSILIFAIGGGMSVSHGYEALVESAAGKHMFRDLTVNYVILVIAMAIEGSSLAIAVKQFNAARREKNMKPMEYIRESKDPSLFTVVLEDTAAEAGLSIALIGMVLWQVTGISYFDGISSVIIGMVLISVAAILMKESKGLLVGEGMTAGEVRRIESIVEEDPYVVECGRVLTNYFGPYSLLVGIDATFADGCGICEAMEAKSRIEAAIKAEFPQTTRIFIEAESLACVIGQQKAMEEMLSEEEDR